jgi:hypothetical protein
MRFYEFKQIVKPILNEGARIDHAEDVVFWEGSKGAARTIESLKSLESGGHKDVTIKWDGSPAIIFGRNADGEFTLTDKSGFGAKGYDGKPKSAKEIEKMFLGRKERKGIEPDDKYKSFAANMRSIYDEYEKAVPKDFVGYFKGDLLYYNRPPVENNQFVFKPQMVTYRVGVNSALGKKIANSTTGVVVHLLMDENGQDGPLPPDYLNIFQGDSVLVFPSITVEKPASVNDESIKNLQRIVAKDAAAMDKFLDTNVLRDLKMTDVPNILYSYMNQKVDTGLTKINSDDFVKWLAGSSVSKAKQTRLVDYIARNKAGLDAIWEVVNGIMEVKNDIIDQFDKHDAEVSASIGDQPGGEGYVLANPQGSIKLVNRAGFTAANRAVQR